MRTAAGGSLRITHHVLRLTFHASGSATTSIAARGGSSGFQPDAFQPDAFQTASALPISATTTLSSGSAEASIT